MKRFGLIGYPLTHSFSKKYFEEKFVREKIADCSYDLFELRAVQDFPLLAESMSELAGLNVTIPYKKSVIDFLDEIDEVAMQVGAVNCIDIRNKKRKGYNTDVFGFETSLMKMLPSHPLQAFILGNGGSSKAVSFVLSKLQIPFKLVSRSEYSNAIAYTEITDYMREHNLFINTTPLGMFPHIDSCPDIPYGALTEKDILFDLIYNPSETRFLQQGREAGCKIKNGLEMLQLQAEKSWELWNA